jgi:hypothetical protein
MRTAPARTIGDIGDGVGTSAIARASEEREEGFGPGFGVPAGQSNTAAAPDARIDGRVSKSLITECHKTRRRTNAAWGRPLFPGLFLGKEPQERLIALLKFRLTVSGDL